MLPLHIERRLGAGVGVSFQPAVALGAPIATQHPNMELGNKIIPAMPHTPLAVQWGDSPVYQVVDQAAATPYMTGELPSGRKLEEKLGNYLRTHQAIKLMNFPELLHFRTHRKSLKGFPIAAGNKSRGSRALARARAREGVQMRWEKEKNKEKEK